MNILKKWLKSSSATRGRWTIADIVDIHIHYHPIAEDAAMDAIELLMQEHQLILRAIDALDGFAGKVQGGLEDRQELAAFVRFIREFADARHHGKEEDILFTAMVAAGSGCRDCWTGISLSWRSGRGNRTLKMLPWPSVLSTSMSPPPRP